MVIENFPPGRKHATGPKRAPALQALTAVLERHAQAAEFTPYGSWQIATYYNEQSNLRMEFILRPRCSISIRISREGVTLFRASKPQDDSGTVLLRDMKWIRGWEAALFDPNWISYAPDHKRYVFHRAGDARRSRRLSAPRVEALTSPAQVAKGRDRAARSINRQLRMLFERSHWISVTDAHVHVGTIFIWFNETPEGRYFRITQSETLMTGYLAPLTGGRYVDGTFAPMTWHRGWEDQLVADIHEPDPKTRPPNVIDSPLT